MSSLRVAASVLGVLATLSLVFAQFLPWGGVSQSFFGASFDVDAYTWRMEMSGDFGGEGGSDTVSWYDEEATEDDDGASEGEVTRIRIAIPMLLAGLVLAALGSILGFVTRGAAAGVLLLVGGIVTAVGTVLFATAVDGLFDSEQDWGAAFYLAIAASALALVGAVLGLVPGGRQRAA